MPDQRLHEKIPSSELLKPIMGEHPKAKPLLTNKDMDVFEQRC